MKKISFSLVLILVLFFSGCAKNDTYVKAIKEPKWLLDPKIEGKTSGVGCATRHYNGETAQKKLALQRAIDEVASQVSVKVQSVSYNQKELSGTKYVSQSNTSSLHTINNENIQTKIVDWYKKPDGDICVLVVKD